MTFSIGSFIGGVIVGIVFVIGYILYSIHDVDDEADWKDE